MIETPCKGGTPMRHIAYRIFCLTLALLLTLP